MARAGIAVAAGDPHAAETATGLLEKGSTAVDACTGGFLAGAAMVPGLLLGSVTLLVAGPGVGAYVFDGSPLQPGKEAPRPRGFREQDPIAPGARVAVPASVAALTAAHAHDGGLGLGEIAAPAVKLATSQGHKGRSALLRRIGQVGPIALREALFVRAMLEVAGRHVGGNLTQADLQEATAAVVPPRRSEGLLLTERGEAAAETHSAAGWVITACDARGVFAALHATYDPEGIELPAVELVTPRFAVPVRRGIPRVRPGARLAVPSPLAMLTEADVPWASVVFESTSELSLEALATSREEGLTFDQRVRNLLQAEQGRVRLAAAVLRGAGPRSPVRALQVTTEAME